MNILYDGLAEVFRTLLKSVDTREKVLEYLAVVIKKNAARSRIQVDPMSCASSGMFVNLSAVMLRLCEPFLDASSSKRDKIDPNYIFYNNRLDLRHLTSLCASSEEVSAWINKNTHEDALKSEDRNDGDNRALQSQQATSSGNNSGISTFSKAKSLMSCKSMVKYSFICECFFMTSRVLNLGLMKALSDYKHLAQELARFEEDLSSYQAMRDQGASLQLETDIKRLEREIEILSQEKLCYEAQILRVWVLDATPGKVRADNFPPGAPVPTSSSSISTTPNQAKDNLSSDIVYRLLDRQKRVAAHATVLKDNKQVHGADVREDEVKVRIVNIILPSTPLTSPNSFTPTVGDVGEGGFTIWLINRMMVKPANEKN